MAGVAGAGEAGRQTGHQAVLDSIAQDNIRDNVDSLTRRLQAAEDALARERGELVGAHERLLEAATQLESLPLLQAQLEVYRADFQAEREARERIAGEKAELEEQLRGAGPGLVLGAGREAGGQLGREAGGQLGQIPATVNTRPSALPRPPAARATPDPAEVQFACPKCNREFRNTTLLTRHVNDCLDRDY